MCLGRRRAVQAHAVALAVSAATAADQSALPLLRGSGGDRRGLSLELSSICEAPTLKYDRKEFIPAAFFDRSYFTFPRQGSLHSFMVGPRGEITMPTDATVGAEGTSSSPGSTSAVSLGTFSHYNHISPAATYANGDDDSRCETESKRREVEVYFIIDRTGATDFSFSYCQTMTCHFHFLIGVPEAHLVSHGYIQYPGPSKWAGLGPVYGRKPFLPEVPSYDVCPSLEILPNSFDLLEEKNVDASKSGYDHGILLCEMSVVTKTDPGSCQASVGKAKGDYPSIMARSDEHSAPFATTCDSRETVHEGGDHSVHTTCNTFAWDEETSSFQDVFHTEIIVTAVDDEAPSIQCPMIPVDMTTEDTFFHSSMMAEDNCGEVKVFCSRPIRGRCDDFSFDMFERPIISNSEVSELRLRRGTFCFMCVAADSSLSDEAGNPIFDEELSNGVLDENQNYLYKSSRGEWKSGQPSDPDSGFLYSSSRVSRVSEPCLVQVNVI